MSIPNIDTFEHDISEEIKTKEATVGDIAAAGGDVGNAPAKPASLSMLVISLGILFLVAVVAISAVLFFKYYASQPIAAPATGTPAKTEHPNNLVRSLSPTLQEAVGQFVKSAQKNEYGYVLEITSYSDVFAYMLKNENAYADEIADTVGSSRDTSTTTPSFVWSDVTLNNQNMRVGTSGSSTVIYAFVNRKYLLISKTTEGILALRSGILH